MTIPIEKEVLQLKTAKRVWKNGAQSVVTEVEPAQSNEVGEGAHLECFQATLAQIQMLQVDVRRQVGSAHHRRPERVSVEVQLPTVDGNSGRDRVETAPRAVDDAARRVAEALARTAVAVAGRQGGDEARPEQARQDRQQRRRRRHCQSSNSALKHARNAFVDHKDASLYRRHYSDSGSLQIVILLSLLLLLLIDSTMS